MSYPVLTATSDKRGSWVRRGGVVLGIGGGGGGGGGGGVLGRRGKDIYLGYVPRPAHER